MRPTAVVCALCLASILPAQWSERTPSTVPPARFDAGMVYDLGRGHTLLFGGGSVPIGLRNDTWTWDGADWTQRVPATAPSARFGMGMAYDVGRNVVVLYGGMASVISIALPVSDTWEWNGTTWNQIAPATNPGGLTSFGFAYDLLRARCVLYGGSSNPGLLVDSNQTWEYDGTNWIHASPATNPGLLERPAMCCHDALARVVLFGGVNPQTGGNDTTWSYDGTNWSQLAVAGSRPAPRAAARMVYDSWRQISLLHGGINATTGAPLDETWEFDGTHWTQVALPVPPSRTRFALAFDIVRRCAVLHGGMTGNLGRTDTHEFGAAYQPLGPGCPGSTGVPVLGSASVPRLGSNFVATLSNLPTSVAVAAVMAGLSSTSSPLGPLPLPLDAFGMPGCMLRTSADVLLFMPAVGGAISVALAVPQNGALLGVQLFQQGLSLEAGVNLAGLVVSNAMTATVGH